MTGKSLLHSFTLACLIDRRVARSMWSHDSHMSIKLVHRAWPKLVSVIVERIVMSWVRQLISIRKSSSVGTEPYWPKTYADNMGSKWGGKQFSDLTERRDFQMELMSKPQFKLSFIVELSCWICMVSTTLLFQYWGALALTLVASQSILCSELHTWA